MVSRPKAFSQILHPFLFATLPILSLLSHNIEGVPLLHAIRPLLLSLTFTLVVLLVLRTAFKEWTLAAQVCSLFLMLFFSYGHVMTGTVHPSSAGLFKAIGLVGRHELLSPVWLALLVFGAWAMHRLVRQRHLITTLFNVMAIGALIVPLYNLVAFEVSLAQPWIGAESISLPTTDQAIPNREAQPDIYYILVDGYGGEAILQEHYAIDNSSFLGGLRDRGFYIADQSQCNYALTVLSLSSSLNMQYLDRALESVADDSTDPLPTARLIRWSEVLRILEMRGYRVMAFATGNRATELENADLFLRPPLKSTTSLESLVIDTSGLVLWRDVSRSFGRLTNYPGFRAHRDRILFALDQLAQAPHVSGPKFVFAHVIIPHPPFVFGPHGDELGQRYPFSLMDGNTFLGTREEYLAGYRGQIAYLNDRLRQVIDTILAESATPPVIILQSDHGPAGHLVWESPDETGVRERMSILNAYYLPGSDGTVLYDSITPVNTFRVILNEYFGGSYPLLPDRSFFSSWRHPYLFELVDSTMNAQP